MKITSIRTEGVGPLPALDWEPGQCNVIYDDNQQGKTTLIDLLIETVFREGRKKLFKDARRYDTYGNARVTLEGAGENIAFGDGGDDRDFSELLGWKLPELHRLLCIRSSQVDLAGPVGGDDLWESLASVVEGMTDNYLDSVRDDILDHGNLTPTLKWQNSQPDYFKDRMLDEIVPGLEQAENGESVLRKALDFKNRLSELEDREETLRTETLEELEATLRDRNRQRELLEVDRARERVEEARKLKTEIDDNYGRIQLEYEESWREAREDLEDERERLEEKKTTLSEYQSERDDLQDRCATIEDELGEIEASLESKQSTLEELEEERDAALESQRRERTRLNELTRRAESVRDDYAQSERRWAVGRWVLISGAILLTGSFLITPFQFLYGLMVGILGLAGTAAGSVLYWLHQKNETEFQSLREKLDDALRDWPVDATDNPVDAARQLLNRDPESLLEEETEQIESLREEVQSLREDRSERQGTLESTTDQLESVEEKIEGLRDDIDDYEESIESLKESCEQFRQKTGLPDFETYRERLEERREREGRLESLRSQLIGQLDVGEDATLSDIRAHVERRVEELEAVELPDESAEELDESIDELEAEIEDRERELQQLQNEIRSVNDQLNETVKPLHDLGVDLDDPEKLFEKENKWETELTEAVRDRLAAAFCVELLENQKGDYMDSIQGLLDRSDDGERNLSELYGSVMDEGSQVELDPDTGEFSVSVNGMTIHEENLSTGARTHLYFSCRLMLLKELFVEEPGFMILDDPFLSYYPDRKRRAIGLLEPYLDAGWQVLFFTVDRTARDTFENELGASVHRIDEL